MPVTDDTGEGPHPAWYLVLFVSAGLCSFAIAFFVKGGIGDMERIEKRQEVLKKQIRAKKQRLRDLKQREKRLHNDPYLIEKLARQKLGLGRPGEKKVKIEDNAGTDSASPPSSDDPTNQSNTDR